jgi:hypothetical protein
LASGFCEFNAACCAQITNARAQTPKKPEDQKLNSNPTIDPF